MNIFRHYFISPKSKWWCKKIQKMLTQHFFNWFFYQPFVRWCVSVILLTCRNTLANSITSRGGRVSSCSGMRVAPSVRTCPCDSKPTPYLEAYYGALVTLEQATVFTVSSEVKETTVEGFNKVGDGVLEFSSAQLHENPTQWVSILHMVAIYLLGGGSGVNDNWNCADWLRVLSRK